MLHRDACVYSTIQEARREEDMSRPDGGITPSQTLNEETDSAVRLESKTKKSYARGLTLASQLTSCAQDRVRQLLLLPAGRLK